MKKLFISCPMKGRTEENIRNSMERMHKIAEATFGEKLEVIQTYIPGKAPDVKYPRVWYLGESIKMMAEADYFIGVDYLAAFKGCLVENEVARNYDIPSTYVDARVLMPDAHEISRKETLSKNPHR